jgi:nucleoside-diphosphate-sugar epimerase
MKRVLVTGASGFLGRHCCTLLADRATEVHGAGRARDRLPAAGACALDLLDSVRTQETLARLRPTHLLHLAWIATPGVYWMAPENGRWVQASMHLLECFARCGGQRAVVAGSCAEYEWCHTVYREHETPTRPATLYGACKNALREAAESYCRGSGVSLAWGRLFFLYGPHERPGRLVPSAIDALLRGVPTDCTGGQQLRDFLYVQDAAQALVELLASAAQGPVNIGSGAAITVAEVVGSLGRIAGRPDLVRLGTRPTPTGEPPCIVADCRRLREEVLWRPRWPLTAGLEHTVAWWRTQRDQTRHAG